jgi:hypothetical protein
MKVFSLLCLAALLSTAAPVQATGTAYHIQVIWGTDEEKPAGTNYRQVGPKLGAKLSPVFRWKHYWETERRKVNLESGKVAKVRLANQRSIEIEQVNGDALEIRLYRISGLVTKTRQARTAKMAILGGENHSKDSFFVVVRTDEPTYP